MKRLVTVLGHEFRMTAANKAFVVITIIGPFLLAAITILPSVLVQRTGERVEPGTTIAVAGADQALLEHMRTSLAENNLETMVVSDADAARQAVSSKDAHGALILPENYLEDLEYQYISETGTDLNVSQTLRSVVSEYVVSRRMIGAGLDPERVRDLTRRPQLRVRKLTETGATEEQDFGSIIITALVFVMLIYMTILFYGQMIGRSVLTEKTQKTVEILLSSVSPRELLFGKILGKGLAGLVQYAIWIGVALVISQWLGPRFGLTMPSGLEPALFGYLLLFFVLAFFLYATGYAAIGSGAGDEQHLGQLGIPLIMMLIIPMISASAIVISPGGTFSVVLSYFPFTAPIVMFVRVMVQTPPAWEIVLSVAVMVLTIVGMVLLSAKIFRVGILMTGKRFKLSEILSWLRA
jgi:ABC-2 type transport system permease protein